MNNFSKARSDVFSTMNNLESLLEDGRINKDKIQQAREYLAELTRMNKVLEPMDEPYATMEKFVDDCFYDSQTAERIRLNLVDIAPDDSELERRKKYLINSIRRAGIKPKISKPLTELDITPASGYYRIIRVMSDDIMVIEVTIAYPPTPTAILEISTTENHHSPSEKLHQIHVDVERYLVELVDTADIVGQVHSPQIHMHLDNILNKIAEAVSVA